MPISLGLGGSKEKSKSTSVLDKTVTGTEEQTGVTSTQQQQTQKQSTLEKAVQDILQSTQQVSEQESRQTGTTAVSGATTQEQAQTSLTSLLSGDIQTGLEGLVSSLIGGEQDGGASDLIALLTGRAGTAEADIAAENAAIVESARFSGERELASLQTLLAQQAGGSLANTGVIAATAEGRAGLESQLAGLQARLNLEGRQTATSELAQALSGAQGEQGQLTNLLNILKGSTAEQTGTVSAAGTQEQTQTQDIQTLAKAISDSISQTRGETTTESISDLFSVASTEQQTQLTKLIEEITKAREVTKSKGSGVTAKAGFEGK